MPNTNSTKRAGNRAFRPAQFRSPSSRVRSTRELGGASRQPPTRLKVAEERAKALELSVGGLERFREPGELSEARLPSCVSRDLAEPTLDPRALGLERKHLGVAVRQRRLDGVEAGRADAALGHPE